MKKIILAVVLVLVAGAAFLMVQASNDDRNNSAEKPLDEVTLALDWTPNTNHTGIYVAQQKGWYAEQGIDLKLLPYSEASSDSLVLADKADVGIGFTEGVVADAGLGTPVVSIASIIAHNTSVIIARKDAGITSPKDLDGKIYGGYGAPYEQPVLSQVIKNDGGKGEYKAVTTYTPVEALEAKKVDFVWVYDGWEGIQAEMAGQDLVKFDLRDYGIPDYSTPNIISSPKTIEQKSDTLKRFMNATSRGYEFARTNPDQAAQMLIDGTDKGTFPDTDFVYKSQKYLSANYQDEGKPWGVVEDSYWQDYPRFMLENKAVVDESGKPVDSLDFNALFTNRFLQ